VISLEVTLETFQPAKFSLNVSLSA